MSGFDDALNIVVRAENGRVEEVKLASPRKNVAPVFVGRTPREATALAKSLFSLCPMAQSLAAQAAGEAASGLAPDAAEFRRRALSLLGERYVEMLRASLLDWPADDAPDAESVAALRETMQIFRALPESSDAVALFGQAEKAAAQLGLYDFEHGAGHFARQWADVVADEKHWDLPPRNVDFLRACDDDMVARAMREPKFALAPQLGGRCVETGARARLSVFAGSLSARIAARFADMAATLDLIGALLDVGEAAEDLLAGKNLDAGEGFAAVESARGRLFHAMRLDGAGRIVEYAIVAPTEWNFHRDGPFVQALRGGNIGTGDAARRRVARLAFAFDPCIRVGVEIRDCVHA